MIAGKQFLGFILFYCLLMGSSCKSKQITIDSSIELARMIQTDKDFSDYSVEHGLVKAFIQYADSAAVYLRDNSMPIEGKSRIAAFFSPINDSTVKLTWSPIFGDVADSGDLGYTYGTFQYESGETIERGSYVSIWKKQMDGSWKWVLDSGNDGLE